MKYQIPIFELLLDDVDNRLMGVENVSVVANPAMESLFVTLKDVEIKLAQDEDKRLTIGAALIPDKKIYRIDDNNNEFYVYFSKETISKIVENFFKNGRTINFNIEHSNQTVEGVVMESWIIDNPEQDKQKQYGFSYPEGTWMLTVKYSQEDWDNYIKKGLVRGYSVEGQFTMKKTELSKQDKILSEDEALKLINAIIKDEI